MSVLNVGGNYRNGAKAGLFYFNGNHDSSYTNGRLGSQNVRIQLKYELFILYPVRDRK
jgi:hypothetical protein